MKEALAALDEARNKFVRGGSIFLLDADAFDLVQKPIEKALSEHPQALAELLATYPSDFPSATARDWVYATIANIAGDHLESGRFHVYRGVLNTMSAGPALLHVFDGSYDELVKSGHIGPDYACEQKRLLRQNMKEVG